MSHIEKKDSMLRVSFVKKSLNHIQKEVQFFDSYSKFWIFLSHFSRTKSLSRIKEGFNSWSLIRKKGSIFEDIIKKGSILRVM